MYVSPSPPYSSGTRTPIIPSSASLRIASRGKVWASSHSMTCGAISASANSRTIRRIASCSSESEKAIPERVRREEVGASRAGAGAMGGLLPPVIVICRACQISTRSYMRRCVAPSSGREGHGRNASAGRRGPERDKGTGQGEIVGKADECLCKDEEARPREEKDHGVPGQKRQGEARNEECKT